MVRSKLRAVVKLIGEAILGFSEEDIGLHSIRSGRAMAMFLSGVSEIIIKRVGRWSSEAFLEYICEQVDSFTVGVSRKMLKYERFHHLNEKEIKRLEDLELENDIDKSDGSKVSCIEIPHNVHYSKQVLNDLNKDLKTIHIS